MSYDASAGGRDRQPLCVRSLETPSWEQLECQDALHVAIVSRTSAIRVLLAFSMAHDPAHNLLLKRGCCHFAQVIGVTSDLRIDFPYLLKICASTQWLCGRPLLPERQWHHSFECPITLVARD